MHRILGARKIVWEALETTGMRGNRKRIDFREDPSCTIKRWYSLNPLVAFSRSHVVRLAFANLVRFSNVHVFPATERQIQTIRFEDSVKDWTKRRGRERERKGGSKREREKEPVERREIVKTDSYVFYTLR